MSETTLSEERLSELLARFKQTLERSFPTRLPHRGCLGLEQLRQWVLTGAGPAAEEHHFAGCGTCARLLERMQAQMPHLPVRVLLGAERGLLSTTEERATERHLSPGGCLWCRERAQAVRSLQSRVAEWYHPLPLPHPDALAAETHGLSAVATSTDTKLEAELAEEGSHLVLEVRTRDSRLNHQLVGYLLYGRERRSIVEGFTVLRSDVDGWFTSCISFRKGDLYSQLSGCCERIIVCPLEPTMLSPTDRCPLLASAGASDASSHSAWKYWLSEAERRLEEGLAPHLAVPRTQLTEVLAEVRNCLEPGASPHR